MIFKIDFDTSYDTFKKLSVIFQKKVKSKHPKKDKYEKLKETINQRREQLSKLNTEDNRKELENELKAAENQLSKMKIKYGF